jgi:hypothetical protein
LKLKFLLLLLAFATTLFANTNNFILKHDGLIDQRAQSKINEIGLETKNKLDVNIYVFILENNGINPDLPIANRIKLMRKFEKNIIDSLKDKSSYAILTISIDQQYTNILMSNNLKDIIDRDDILDGYVIPLLASKDKNSLFAKTSAAVLNGYAQIADSIAESKKIKLESSIGSEGKIASTIWKVFMYTLVIFGIGAYTIIIMRERKARRNVK